MPMPQLLPALLRLMPKGAIDLSMGTLAVEDLSTVAESLDTEDQQAALLLSESRPQDATALLSLWESLVGLRNRGLSDSARRDRILARLRLVPDMCPNTIETRSEQYTGISFVLSEIGPLRCDFASSTCDTVDDVADGAFVFVLDADASEAHLGLLRRTDLLTLVEDMKPAHTLGIVRLDDFFTNDSLSVTDCDLIGA